MELKTIRKRLDIIDRQLLTLIAKRQSYMQDVARYKKAHQLPINQPKREKEVLKAKKAEARKIGVDPKLIESIWHALFKNAKDIQRKLK